MVIKMDTAIMARKGKNLKSDMLRSRVIVGDHFLGE